MYFPDTYFWIFFYRFISSTRKYLPMCLIGTCVSVKGGGSSRKNKNIHIHGTSL